MLSMRPYNSREPLAPFVIVIVLSRTTFWKVWSPNEASFALAPALMRTGMMTLTSLLTCCDSVAVTAPCPPSLIEGVAVNVSVAGGGSSSKIITDVLRGKPITVGFDVPAATDSAKRKVSEAGPSYMVSFRMGTEIVFSVSFAPNESVPDVAV